VRLKATRLGRWGPLDCFGFNIGKRLYQLTGCFYQFLWDENTRSLRNNMYSA
jgi:hypothetical protein